MAASVLVLPPIEISTYHRIISPTLQLPEDESVPIPVGLLACQRNPVLTELKTNVIYCRASQGLQPPKDKKKRPQISELQCPIFEVLLHDTVIFPEGGGQPSDIGYIKDEAGNQWDVLEAKRHGSHAVHYIKGGDSTPGCLTQGCSVIVGLGDMGFRRRYDHMCMHTAQHLISALLETKLDLPSPSWYLAPSPEPSYIEVPRAPSAVQLKEIEDTANEHCFRGTQVHVEVEEIKDERMNGDRGSAFKSLPTDYTGGINRTIVIEGVDRNPCCGTHLSTLHGLSIFILPETEPLSRGRARIYFCAGDRVRAYLSRTHGFLSAAATSYGCAPNQVAERLLFEADGRKKAHKRVEELERELAESIVREWQRTKSDVIGRRFSAFYHRQDSSPNPLAFLNAIEMAWNASTSLEDPHLFILVCTGTQASSNKATILVFGSDEKEIKQIGDELKAKGVKGGGKNRKWSGKTDDWKGEEWIKGLLH